MDYSKKVSDILNFSEIRSQIDERSEKTGRKIRDAEVRKIPFMLIVGEKEEAEGTVSVRRHGVGDLGSFKIDDFINLVNKEVNEVMQ